MDDDDNREVLGKKRTNPHYLFPLDSIDFSVVAKIASTYTARAREINSAIVTLDEMVFDASNPHKAAWKIKDILQDSKTGEKYKIEFNPDGSLAKFSKF